MKILYFARIREYAGLAEESAAPPEDIRTVADLMAWLQERRPGLKHAFADDRQVRAALDQSYADLNAPIAGAQEIAFFPPVSGG